MQSEFFLNHAQPTLDKLITLQGAAECGEEHQSDTNISASLHGS